ncbi:MAG: transcription-repair coupling factor [Candidatus Gastranaerophilales bacterium]|nr:transcription-repair coupling factor [Candidatus Gastranaerophilales bacterium]
MITNYKMFEDIFKALNSIPLKSAKHISLSGFLAPFNLFLAANLVKNNKKVLYITSDEQSALKYQKDLKNLLNEDSYIFPMQEISRYCDLDKNYYTYQEQVNILLNRPNIVIASTKSLLERFNTIDFYKNNSIKLKKDLSIDYSEIAKKLTRYGYKRTTQVSDIGEFALRGDILDIYTLTDCPVRIEFFADTIEDIRKFNPNTQKSYSHIDEINILPLYKFILDDDNKNNFIKKINGLKLNDFQTKIKEELIEKLQETGYFEGIEYYYNYFSNNSASFLDFFNDYIILFDETSAVLSKYKLYDENDINAYNEAISSNLKLPLEKLNHTAADEFLLSVKKFNTIGLDNFLDDNYDKLIEFDMNLVPFFSSDIMDASKFIKKYLNLDYKIHICTNFPTRLKEIFDELEIFSPSIFYHSDISSKGAVWDKERIIFIGDKELFNKRNRDITAKRHYSNKENVEYIESIDDIQAGEYVVHAIHGIGIYNGISKQIIDDTQKDYLEIQFQGSDKLFMPAEQINLLTRYRGTNAKPKLSKMGGNAWENTKAKAKKELELIAYDLLDLYAKREMAQGIQFEPDSTWQFEMEDNFEYIETPDQMKAINETKKDMEDTKPMDRLICADVGFGKTEVALRAMFKAVMSGYQTALIAPTTILTMQHFETIKERFEPYDIKMAILNRFCTKKEQKETIKNINEGSIDVVVATHRLLSDDIKFKKLGLLVIDEEHKFGVRQKEKIKQYKENIDILSLSATPIPRTLNMALSGLKDMSVINTPPKNRLPIKTYVGEFSATYVKNAINQEMQREGQIYYLYNKVETIERFKKTLQDIVPSARIGIAHGQMTEHELENAMCKFEQKEYDILLCSTIIESGLDIPNANTIIIHDAQNFGLAQLYQLRGRVGRSDRQAYCFCFYKNGVLQDDAKKRLESIKSFTNLGSGYKIALRDIEIRGVGSLLGTRQHGQMASVGFDTYCNLLAECIEDIKARRSKNPYEIKSSTKNENTIIDIHIDAYIPDDWAQTYEQKILEYKRLSDAQTLSELEDMKVNLKDRFGSVPECVENLIKLIKLRILASNANIQAVRDCGNVIRINTPYTQMEWNILKSKIDFKYTKYFKFTLPPKNLNKTKGIILVNKNEDSFDEIFNKLADLFYYISEVVLNFKY